VAEDRRRRGADVPGGAERVGDAHRRRAHADDHLALSRRAQLDVLDHQGRADLLDDRCSHRRTR
jgi:hypothetical protein